MVSDSVFVSMTPFKKAVTFSAFPTTGTPVTQYRCTELEFAPTNTEMATTTMANITRTSAAAIMTVVQHRAVQPAGHPGCCFVDDVERGASPRRLFITLKEILQKLYFFFFICNWLLILFLLLSPSLFHQTISRFTTSALVTPGSRKGAAVNSARCLSM